MSFFGGGTDMESFFRENGGAVLSTTFDKYCYVNVRHLRQLPFIVAGDAVRQHMNGVAAFRHVVAGGFDAGCGIRSNNIKICNAMLLNKSGKCLAGQGVAPTVYRQYAQYPQNQRFFITPLYVCPKRIIFAHVSVPLIGF